MLVVSLQNFLDKLDCDHFALLLRIRIRDALIELACLEGIHLVVFDLLILDHFSHEFLAFGLFSLRLGIFLICLVFLTYNRGMAFIRLQIPQFEPRQALCS